MHLNDCQPKLVCELLPAQELFLTGRYRTFNFRLHSCIRTGSQPARCQVQAPESSSKCSATCAFPAVALRRGRRELYFLDFLTDLKRFGVL